MDQRVSAESLQESVKKQVAERPGLLARAGPAALTAVLGAAALWPVVAPLLGGASGGRLAFAPDGSVLVSLGGTIDAWDIPARRQIADGLGVTPVIESVQEVAFAGDPPTLVSLGESRPYVVDPIIWSGGLAAFEERVCGIVNRNLVRDEIVGYPADREPGRCVR